VCQVGSISEDDITKWGELVKEMRQNKHLADENVLDEIQRVCFVEMYLNTFMPFKKTDAYKNLRTNLDDSYNKVDVTDFEYMAKLGVGGFGRVIHVRKKSTGKHYALKTQLKTALVETYADNPSRLDSEKVVFAACHHPFIIDMDYAFQTEGHAILVLGLATAGDLQEAIDDSPENRLDERRVMFYGAEVRRAKEARAKEARAKEARAKRALKRGWGKQRSERKRRRERSERERRHKRSERESCDRRLAWSGGCWRLAWSGGCWRVGCLPSHELYFARASLARCLTPPARRSRSLSPTSTTSTSCTAT
jgi:hypothetical protein